jgi:3-oxoacyl-[acyl-carrier protein] reductase
MSQNKTLSGKVALVTGASRGIGAAIALKFAELGADVAIIYSSNVAAADDVVAQIEKTGVRAIALQCDVSDFDGAKGIVAKVVESLGKVDILVNNAGVTKDALVFSMKEADFNAVVDTSLKGAFNFTKHVYPLFIKQKSGRIINMASISGLRGIAGQANYSAAKAGIIGLTKAVARELAGRGVTVNAIAPGFIATDMTKNLEVDMKEIPAGRVGEAQDVAELAAFLASDSASYITGEVIRVDGGLAI